MRGCVTQKGGRWYVVVYNSETKKYKWYSRDDKNARFETKADAEKYANTIANKVMDKVPLPDSRQTVQNYLQTWLERRRGKVEETSYERYSSLIRLHVVPKLGHIRLTRLTVDDVEQFYTDKLMEKQINETTLHQLHYVLHKAFRDGVKKEKVARNVFDIADAPKKADTIPNNAPWDFEQAKLFLAEARRTSKWHGMYLFTICTASRESEVIALQRSDLDLLLGEVHIRRKMYRLYGKDRETKIIEGTPKSKHGIRTIPLIPQLVDELRKHLATRDALREQFGNTYSQDGNGQLVFCQPNGKYLHIRHIIEHDFRMVCERAKVPLIRFHDLKHCTASFLRALGVDSYTVSVICGHHSAAFTDEHYVHTVNGTLRDAMKRLEGALSLTPPSASASASAENP